MSSDLRAFIITSVSSASPASSSASPSSQMSSASSSSSSWTKENHLISQSVPLPAKLKPTTSTMTSSSSGGSRDLPTITLSTRGSTAAATAAVCGFRMDDRSAAASGGGSGGGVEGPRCLSLPLSRVQDQIQQRQAKPPQQCDPQPSYTNCSSSLDNLSLFAPSSGPTIPIGGGCGIGGMGVQGRLIKASSDNPVYGLSASPPIPPRDYIPRAISRPTMLLDQRPHPHQHPHHQQSMSGARTPEIHPIVQDGQKRSNTHYWLLPDKQKTSASLDDVDKMTSADEPLQHYVNIATATNNNNNNNGLWARTFGISKASSFGKKGGNVMSARKEETTHRRSHHSSEGAADPRTCHESIFYSDVVPLLSDVSSLDSMSVNIAADDETEGDDRVKMMRSIYPSGGEDDGTGGRTTSMGEVKEMIETVQSKINGVTADESFTALATNHWNVDSAVEYLKVENLFRLGLATRERCRRKLEINNWSVERAASDLLDLLGIDLSK